MHLLFVPHISLVFAMMIFMSKPKSVENICRAYCSFYKPDKEDALVCRGITAAESLLGSERGLLEFIDPNDTSDITTGRSNALQLSDILCPSCDFQKDGCDFIVWIRAHRNEWPSPSPPCGGFVFLCRMIEKSRIDFDRIKKVLY